LEIEISCTPGYSKASDFVLRTSDSEELFISPKAIGFGRSIQLILCVLDESPYLTSKADTAKKQA
jgi:hypothetical protein